MNTNFDVFFPSHVHSFIDKVLSYEYDLECPAIPTDRESVKAFFMACEDEFSDDIMIADELEPDKDIKGLGLTDEQLRVVVHVQRTLSVCDFASRALLT